MGNCGRTALAGRSRCRRVRARRYRSASYPAESSRVGLPTRRDNRWCTPGFEYSGLAYSAEGELSPTVAQETLTNDRGEYRAFWLAPGQYLVSATRSQLNTFSSEGITDPLGLERTIPTTFTGNSGRPVAVGAHRIRRHPLRLGLGQSLCRFSQTRPMPRVPMSSHCVRAVRPQASTFVSRRLPQRSAPVELRGTVIDPRWRACSGQLRFVHIDVAGPVANNVRECKADHRDEVIDGSQFAPGAQTWVNDDGRF
jgi:hypothetical protein